jgi:hypothetical protein
MLTFMPTLGTLLQGFVVTLLVLFDESLQTNVATNFITQVIALEQEDKPGNSAIAVPKRMDTEEVEVKTSQSNERMNPPLAKRAVPHLSIHG